MSKNCLLKKFIDKCSLVKILFLSSKIDLDNTIIEKKAPEATQHSRGIRLHLQSSVRTKM